MTCARCKFITKVFDGMYSETWLCSRLREMVHVMDVGITMAKRKTLMFSVEYGFGCVLFEPNDEYDPESEIEFDIENKKFEDTEEAKSEIDLEIKKIKAHSICRYH